MSTEKKVSIIRPDKPHIQKKLKVAAYARVSMESDRMLNSISNQVSYYSQRIQSNPEWEFAGIFADYGISGTGIKDRKEFNRMLKECEAGKINLILTKSIQRFARNTVDLLQTVRHLRELGIEIRFEKEQINTLSGDGELLLTLLASFAQEESRSISENAKWAIRKKYETGHIRGCKIYGYKCSHGEYTIIPEQAEIVRRIFRMYLDGENCYSICRILQSENVKSHDGKDFSNVVIREMLCQEKYAGDVFGQKQFVKDLLPHKEVINNGEMPMYIMEDAIPPIVDRETFNAVQQEMSKRYGAPIVNGVAGFSKKNNEICRAYSLSRMAAYWTPENRERHNQLQRTRAIKEERRYPLTKFVKCGTCGENMVGQKHYYVDGSEETKWTCCQLCRKLHTNDRPVVMENEALMKQIAEHLGLTEFTEEAMLEKLTGITVKVNMLTFHYIDGHTEEFEFIPPKRGYRRKESK